MTGRSKPRTIISKKLWSLSEIYAKGFYCLADKEDGHEVIVSAADLDAICEAWQKWKEGKKS